MAASKENAMAKISSIKPGSLPKSAVSDFSRDINKLIDKYNALNNNFSQKKEVLKEMQLRIQQMDCTYKFSDIANSPDYHAARKMLYTEIKTQYALLGTNSLITSPEKSSPLSELIANMHPDKADELFKILMGVQVLNLQKLYEGEHSEEAKRFNQFYSNHTITILGGANSKNFKVTHKLSGSSQVLKVDLRFDQPKSVELHLQDKVTRLAPVAAERQVVYLDTNKQKKGGTLLVTEFYENSSLYHYRVNKVSEAMDKTADIFKQMAETLLEIQSSGCLFPDAKVDNWLVDPQGNLFIADTKSFVFTEKGLYNPKLQANKEYIKGLITTSGFMFPELDLIHIKNIDADKCHAFLLGKNLYYHLTEPNNTHDNSVYNFNYDVFKSAKGILYKELIQELLNPEPSKRISVATALEKLTVIQNIKEQPAVQFDAMQGKQYSFNQQQQPASPIPKHEPKIVVQKAQIKNEHEYKKLIQTDTEKAKKYLDELDKLKFGTDKIMQKYIAEKSREFYSSLSEEYEEERKNVLKDLEATVNSFKEDPNIKAIRDIIASFRNRAGVFTIGMNAKANKIEEEMAKIPVAERGNFLGSTSADKIIQALAAKRTLLNTGEKAVPANSDDAKKTFETYKQKYLTATHQVAKQSEKDFDAGDELSKSPKKT